MGTLEHKIINNFLEKETFNNLKNTLFSNKINWFFLPNMTTNNNKDHYFFNHCFYNYYMPQSIFFEDLITPILKKLNAVAISEVRANLILKEDNSYQSEFHVDRPYECKTAILYINTCNGYTLLHEDKKIKINSEENKILIFNSQISHAGVSQTDVDRRIVINFNYF
jgi:hypothetical protein